MFQPESGREPTSPDADTTDFTNEPIARSSVPVLSDSAFEPLDPKYLKLYFVGLGLFLVVATLVLAVVSTQVPDAWVPLAIMGAIWLLATVIAVLKRLEVKHLAYQVREHDISFRHGILSQQTETLPYIRVQHVRVHRGPIERKFGLAHLSIHSAGPDLNIPGLSGDEVERLRLFIVERAGALVESP